jgi:hypothetical protein
MNWHLVYRLKYMLLVLESERRLQNFPLCSGSSYKHCQIWSSCLACLDLPLFGHSVLSNTVKQPHCILSNSHVTYYTIRTCQIQVYTHCLHQIVCTVSIVPWLATPLPWCHLLTINTTPTPTPLVPSLHLHYTPQPNLVLFLVPSPHNHSPHFPLQMLFFTNYINTSHMYQ